MKPQSAITQIRNGKCGQRATSMDSSVLERLRDTPKLSPEREVEGLAIHVSCSCFKVFTVFPHIVSSILMTLCGKLQR